MADQTKDNNKAEEAQPEIIAREIPIKYYGTEETIGIFADQVMISHATGLFTLFFFQLQIPPSEKPKAIKDIEAIPARCVARIVLTPDLMEQFYKAIEINMGRYKHLLAEQQPPAQQQLNADQRLQRKEE